MTNIKDIYELGREIQILLDNSNIFSTSVYTDYSPLADKNPDMIKIEIERGDWKHDHLYADYLIKEFLDNNGLHYFQIAEETTEEDGSDCYSAIHGFVIMNFRWKEREEKVNG